MNANIYSLMAISLHRGEYGGLQMKNASERPQVIRVVCLA